MEGFDDPIIRIKTYKDRVLGPGGRLPGSFGRLIRTPAARSVLNHHPVLPVVPIPPCPRWSWSTALSLALLGHLSRRQVPHGGKVGAVSDHRRQIGRLEGSLRAAVRASASDRGSGALEQQGERVTRSTSSSIRLAKAALATLERGQAVYPPPDGQRTADLNPAGRGGAT